MSDYSSNLNSALLKARQVSSIFQAPKKNRSNASVKDKENLSKVNSVKLDDLRVKLKY